MTDLLPELASSPVYGTFDGELIALDNEGAPDFPLICEQMLGRRRHIPITYVLFDIPSLDGRSLMGEPYSERRRQIEALDLDSISWSTTETFDEGEALFEAVCERELEGIVAKRVDSRYVPGYRGWMKIKNRAYWRYELERESAINKTRVKQFV